MLYDKILAIIKLYARINPREMVRKYVESPKSQTYLETSFLKSSSYRIDITNTRAM